MSETTIPNETQSPKALKDRLRGRTLRSRIGLLLVPPQYLSDMPEIAARLGMDLSDYAQAILNSLPADAKRSGITVDAEHARLDQIADAPNGSDIVLVSQFDLAVARLSVADRGQLWRILREGFAHRRRALLLAMPQGAERLLPEGEEGDAWNSGMRVALWSFEEE